MKINRISVTLLATLALGLASCSKDEPITPVADAANKAVGSTFDAASKAAEAEAAKAAEAAKGEAAKSADSAKTQGLIDKAISLIAEGKFSDASSVLQQLAGQSLSGDQAKLVDGLKEQIQKALVAKAADNAEGGVGKLLKK